MIFRVILGLLSNVRGSGGGAPSLDFSQASNSMYIGVV